jgi:putative zinc finger protein
MSHLDEGTLHALLDGELDLKEVSEIQIHLGSCVACGSRLQEVRQFLAEADRLVGALETPSAREPYSAHRASPEPPRASPPPPRSSQREPEIWEPPPLLLPDAPDSAAQKHRWGRGLALVAAVAVVLLGGRMLTDAIGPRHPMLPERDLTTARPAVPPPVASPEETGKQSQPQVAAKQVKPARPPAQNRAAALKSAPEPKVAAAAERSLDSARDRADSEGFAYEDSAPTDQASLAAGAVAESSATDSVFSEPPRENDELTRRAAAEALAQLDRERRRERANAATAALPPARTEVPPAAESVAPAPPRTLEQRAQIYMRIGLDEANKQLGGPVHVIEGMSPQFIGLTPGRSVAGADPSRPVVRVVYLDSRERMILLDQQRLRNSRGPAAAEGSLRWVVGDVMLYLRGEPSTDVLRSLQRRVR